MSELMLPPQDITQEVAEYGQRMVYFTESSHFPSGLLSAPDHVMIKSETPSDFDNKVRELKPWAEYRAFTQIDWRFLVAARLIVPLSIVPNRPVSWLEIMEAKSPDGTVDYIGAEYVSFFFDNLGAARQLMEKRKIDHQERHDGIHRWISVPMNRQGQEIRIADKHVEEIIDKEIENDEAHFLAA